MANSTQEMPVRVIESPRRKKTVSARVVNGVIEIRMPVGLRASERQRHIEQLTAKLHRSRDAAKIDLTERARGLARRYKLPPPATIAWSTRQNSRWGSCTPDDRTIRISHRMSAFPTFVIDYVIVHELAHLVERNHNAAFHSLVARFPKAERAEGFLLAVSLGHGGSLSGSIPDEGCSDGG